MGPFPLLLLGHLDQAVPVLLLQELLELPGTVSVRPLTDDERSRLLLKVRGREQAGHGGGVFWRSRRRLLAGNSIDDGLQVCERRPAAPADDVDPELGD